MRPVVLASKRSPLGSRRSYTRAYKTTGGLYRTVREASIIFPSGFFPGS